MFAVLKGLSVLIFFNHQFWVGCGNPQGGFSHKKMVLYCSFKWYRYPRIGRLGCCAWKDSRFIQPAKGWKDYYYSVPLIEPLVKYPLANQSA